MRNKILLSKCKNYKSQLYYIHIPKTGGTYIKKFLDGLVYNSNIYHGFASDNILSYSNIIKKEKNYTFKNYHEDFLIKKPLIFINVIVIS